MPFPNSENPFTSEPRRSWQRRSEAVKRIGSATRRWTPLCTRYPVPLVFLAHYAHTLYLKHWVETAKVLKNEAGEEQWTRLFSMQESIAHILQILQMNKFLKGLLHQAYADCNSAWKCQSRDNLFQYLGYDCLLSRHNFYLEKSVGLKAQQIGEAKKSLWEGTRGTVS